MAVGICGDKRRVSVSTSRWTDGDRLLLRLPASERDPGALCSVRAVLLDDGAQLYLRRVSPVTPYYEDAGVRMLHGDCLEVLLVLDSDSLDACVTDPPYELGFMGKRWDASGVANNVDLWREVLRVLKPGAHLLAFGGTRTYHRMASAIEDAGFEIRDSLMWIYGQGFPKSLNLGEGLGTALKPAHEPIVLARKPFKGTVAANVERYATGALHIEACRIATDEELTGGAHSGASRQRPEYSASDRDATVSLSRLRNGGVEYEHGIGRWPANVLLDEEAAAMLDEQSGDLSSPWIGNPRGVGDKGGQMFGGGAQGDVSKPEYSDIGGASRFFYVAKPSREERDMGCEGLRLRSAGECTDRQDGTAGLNNPRAGAGRTGGGRNIHPTVKPVELMRWLVRLITPPGGVVLDPFMGSGTTGMACKYELREFIGIEREPDYIAIAERRIAAVCPLFSEPAEASKPEGDDGPQQGSLLESA
jgi:DNA modification methylase